MGVRGVLLLAMLLGPAFAQAPEGEGFRLVPPPSLTRLQVPTRTAAAPSVGKPRIPAAGQAVVEVTDRDPEASDRAIQLRLSGEAHEVLRFAPGPLLASELGAFMAEAASTRPDFAKALLNASMDYWMPRPFHLDGLVYQTGRFGVSLSTGSLGSQDTSRRGPVGR